MREPRLSSGVWIEKLYLPTCYETPKEERISCAFGNLIDNIKIHNGVKL